MICLVNSFTFRDFSQAESVKYDFYLIASWRDFVEVRGSDRSVMISDVLQALVAVEVCMSL